MMDIDLEKYDALGLECDGMSRLLHEHLVSEGIDHTVISGVLRRTDGKGPKTRTLNYTIPPLTVPMSDNIAHVWIVFAPDRYLDLRARMWFGDDAPHGIFDPADHPTFEYEPDHFHSLLMNVKWGS